MKPAINHTAKQQQSPARRYQHRKVAAGNLHKFHPASRTERLSSWNHRLQLLFTRQTY